jgi:hypothetical protein
MNRAPDLHEPTLSIEVKRLCSLVRYVVHARVEDYLRLGWMFLAPLGEWSVLTGWQCECEPLERVQWPRVSTDAPWLVPVMAGSTCAGFLIGLGPRGVEAFDKDEKLLGVFPDAISAATAVEKSARGGAS